MSLIDQGRKALGQLPGTLKVLLVGLLTMPFWSLQTDLAPWTLYQHGEVWRACLIFGVYWLVPLVLSGTVLLRSFMVIPLFLVECFGLLSLAVAGSVDQTPGIRFVRIALL